MSSNEFGKIEKLLRQAGLENAECGEIEDRIGMEPPGFGATDSQVIKFEQAINSQQNENV